MAKEILVNYLNKPDTYYTVMRLIRGGVIKDSTILTNLEIFNDFMMHPSPVKNDRYIDLGKKYNQHPESISRIIRNLKKPI